MKIVNFKSGLGNQIFYYLMYRYLQEKYPETSVYGYYNKKFLKIHNGLEMDRVFDVQLPKQTLWSDLVCLACRISDKARVSIFNAKDSGFTDLSIYFDGWWQDKKFFLDHVKELKFKQFNLSKENEGHLNLIQKTDSVSIHIRRGDYLSPNVVSIYGNICTLEYYKSAIEIIKKKYSNPRFFIFSDDILWAKENMDVSDAVYVTNNKNSDSYFDLFLMSKCKANIIANSSFSYWAAMLNENRDKSVVYPSKWSNIHTPDIFPKDWQGLR